MVFNPSIGSRQQSTNQTQLSSKQAMEGKQLNPSVSPQLQKQPSPPARRSDSELAPRQQFGQDDGFSVKQQPSGQSQTSQQPLTKNDSLPKDGTPPKGTQQGADKLLGVSTQVMSEQKEGSKSHQGSKEAVLKKFGNEQNGGKFLSAEMNGKTSTHKDKNSIQHQSEGEMALTLLEAHGNKKFGNDKNSVELDGKTFNGVQTQGKIGFEADKKNGRLGTELQAQGTAGSKTELSAEYNHGNKVGAKLNTEINLGAVGNAQCSLIFDRSKKEFMLKLDVSGLAGAEEKLGAETKLGALKAKGHVSFQQGAGGNYSMCIGLKDGHLLADADVSTALGLGVGFGGGVAVDLKAMLNGAQKTAHAIQNGAQSMGEKFQQGYQQTGQAFQQVGSKVYHGLQHAGEKLQQNAQQTNNQMMQRLGYTKPQQDTVSPPPEQGLQQQAA